MGNENRNRNDGNIKSNEVKTQIFKLSSDETIDYKQVDVLLSFLTEHGKIKSRRLTNLTLKQQRQLSKSVKRARAVNLLPHAICVEN